ncbi:hypothetical protein ACFFX1_12885 [Dactylosporangium sucinum]|uniref:Uncharacterized protein n=1 Tax=Dactylosporangium sucinum TaxID=1424081 RepID=A0A917TWB8_9ACTN|nr:hypothetical protein [Dactylosporangium sucinum]GGM41198.1 hypothetical protein GCM10007977_048260 [Dactylosporangium sucinum]
MIEILDNLGILARPDLDLSTLSLAGARYGSNAATSIDRARIKEVTFSPIVRRGRSSTGIESEYYAADGRRIPLDEVIDSVITADGMLHLHGHVSYKIAAGIVVGFALYGADRGHLTYFRHLRSYDDFLAAFGRPDRVERNEAFGDLLGYDNSYWASKKQANWDSWDERLSSVSLGSYEGNNGPSEPPKSHVRPLDRP